MAKIVIEYEIDDEEIQEIANEILGRDLDSDEIQEVVDDLEAIAQGALEESDNLHDIIEDLYREESEEDEEED